MIRRLLARTAALAALMVVPGAAFAGGPFGGFFESRGGAYYSPLHFWAPAAYRVNLHIHGTECPGCRGQGYTVAPPAYAPYAPITSPTIAAPAPASPIPGSLP